MCGVLHSALYGTKSLDLEENAQDATRKTKLSRKQPKYQNIPYQNQNFISISHSNHSSKTIIALAAKKRDKTNYCTFGRGSAGQEKNKKLALGKRRARIPFLRKL